jgi:hypothetical protein
MVRLVGAELKKFVAQRGLFMAAVFIVPAFATLIKILMQVVVFRRVGQSNLGSSVDLVAEASRSFGLSGNTLAHLFFALGVASIFVVDYRFSTWRHFVPRRSRSQLWLAKFLAACCCLILSLLLVTFSDLFVTMLVMAVDGTVLTPLAGLEQLFLLFSVAVLELLALVSVTALLTVLFRSSMAAVLIAFLLTLGSVLVQAYLGAGQDLWWLPSIAANDLRILVTSSASSGAVTPLAALLAWTIVPGVLGLALFNRQELATE